MEKDEIEKLISDIIGCCVDVHIEIGPGFSENAYCKALRIKFKEEGINFEADKEIQIRYHGEVVDTYVLHFFIEGEIVLVIKTVDEIRKNYYAQVRSYLKVIRKDLGLLVNFSDYKIDLRRVERNRKQIRN